MVKQKPKQKRNYFRHSMENCSNQVRVIAVWRTRKPGSPPILRQVTENATQCFLRVDFISSRLVFSGKLFTGRLLCGQGNDTTLRSLILLRKKQTNKQFDALASTATFTEIFHGQQLKNITRLSDEDVSETFCSSLQYNGKFIL